MPSLATIVQHTDLASFSILESLGVNGLWSDLNGSLSSWSITSEYVRGHYCSEYLDDFVVQVSILV